MVRKQVREELEQKADPRYAESVHSLASRIEAVIKEHYQDGTGLSQAHLRRYIRDVELEGNHFLSFGSHNVVFMVGISEVLCDALAMLLEEDRISLKVASLRIMLMDGCPMPTDMPLMGRKLPRNGYKRPHFCPTLLCVADSE
jgi:hypothetical protein